MQDISSNIIIKRPFGLQQSCVKNTSELKIKNSIKTGRNIKFPTNVITDVCKPQPTRIGIETSETTSCACKKLSKYFVTQLFNFSKLNFIAS
jgi:hypothetical protein